MSTVNPYASPTLHPTDDPPLVAQLAVDGEAMTIEFEQTLEDLLAFQYYLVAQMGFVAPGRRAWSVLTCAGLLMLLGTFLLFAREGFGDLVLIPILGFTIVVLIAVMWPIFIYHYRWYIRRMMRKLTARGRNLNITGPRRVVITPGYLVYSSPAFQTAYRWSCLEKTLVESDNLFVFISLVDAIVIPRRAFNSDLHFKEFAAQAMKYHADHLRGERPIATSDSYNG